MMTICNDSLKRRSGILRREMNVLCCYVLIIAMELRNVCYSVAIELARFMASSSVIVSEMKMEEYENFILAE